jgi:hypothetical protein
VGSDIVRGDQMIMTSSEKVRAVNNTVIGMIYGMLGMENGE